MQTEFHMQMINKGDIILMSAMLTNRFIKGEKNNDLHVLLWISFLQVW